MKTHQFLVTVPKCEGINATGAQRLIRSAVKSCGDYTGQRISVKVVSNELGPIAEKRLQSLAVCRPLRRAGSGYARIVVEVYALGIGIAVEAHGHDLHLPQGAFEIETPERRLVLNVGNARHTEWFVGPVKRNVAPVFEPLEALNEQQAAQVNRVLRSHIAPRAVVNTAILSLPCGWGKTHHAAVIGRLLGCTHTVEEWLPERGLAHGALHLTNADVSGMWT